MTGGGGLSPAAEARIREGEGRSREALEAAGAVGAPLAAFFVPGRIEVLGKHTDYAGGRSLLCALEFGFSVVVAEGPDHRVRVVDVRSAEEVALDPGEVGGGPLGAAPGWAIYPLTVLRRIIRDFPGAADRGGAVIAFHSSLPPASGMSSSSAMVAALYLALAARWELPAEPDPLRLAGYLAAMEAGRPWTAPGTDHAAGSGRPPSDGPGMGDLGAPGAAGGSGPPTGGRPTALTGVGTDGGSEDHAAILCARPGAVIRCRFRPSVLEATVPLPPGWTFGVAASGVAAEKAGAARVAYNRLSDEAGAIARGWRETTGETDPHLGAILARGPDARRRLEALLPPDLRPRLSQFVAECDEIIPEAEEALARGDVEAFGEAVARSHALAEQVLGNQVPETVALVRLARELGSPAASAFGAGFGGAVWALFLEEEAGDALARWEAAYLDVFPERGGESAFLISGAGPAAFRIR
jgi:galactokinase